MNTMNAQTPLHRALARAEATIAELLPMWVRQFNDARSDSGRQNVMLDATSTAKAVWLVEYQRELAAARDGHVNSTIIPQSLWTNVNMGGRGRSMLLDSVYPSRRAAWSDGGAA